MATLTRQRIIDTARREIERHGHETLSLRGIARRLDVTAPALYDHVGSRDEIIRGVAEAGYRDLIDAFDVAGVRAIDRCRNRADAYVRFARERPELFRAMFLYRPTAVAIEADNQMAAADDTFALGLTDLAEAMADGDLETMDPARMNLILWTVVHGVATVSLMAPAVGAMVTDEVIDAVFTGLAPAPASQSPSA